MKHAAGVAAACAAAAAVAVVTASDDGVVIAAANVIVALHPGAEAVPPALLHRPVGETWHRPGEPDLLQGPHTLFCHDCYQGEHGLI